MFNYGLHPIKDVFDAVAISLGLEKEYAKEGLRIVHVEPSEYNTKIARVYYCTEKEYQDGVFSYNKVSTILRNQNKNEDPSFPGSSEIKV